MYTCVHCGLTSFGDDDDDDDEAWCTCEGCGGDLHDDSCARRHACHELRQLWWARLDAWKACVAGWTSNELAAAS